MKLIYLLLLLLPFCAISQQQVLIPYRKGIKFGYCDSAGNLIIKPQFLYANFFVNKLAAVRIAVNDEVAYPGGTATIYIDQNGKLAIKDTFEFGGQFYKEWVQDSLKQFVHTYIAQVEKSNKSYFINEFGSKVSIMEPLDEVPEHYPLLEKRLAEVSTKELFVLYTKRRKMGVRLGNKIIIPAKYDNVSSVDKEGRLYIAIKNQKRAIIRIESRKPLKWYENLRFLGSVSLNKSASTYYFSVIDKSKRYGIVDQNNILVLNNSYNYIGSIDKNGAVLVRIESATSSKGNLDGLFNLINRTLVPPKYEYITPTDMEGIYRVEYSTIDKKRRTYLININGREYFSE